ncbi:Carbonic anhydrase or acetyltransferase, isoleucine patch superfamily [Cohaesibacter marisflavi]|uniref:Carbonic anhydrase or acetyltransferase, isoleucine patch superfamily n=1 Tax=Cohaesibacter marisflavi TaxID=655353 RepID=A0A1I4Z9G6_9HYPH|nr:gamma carbonic anhydrase family protein [Cohaesibacter marisflavi]SFN46915.1 Carbonic anhydrase or acetyltransferase, isoleucine patch superfamily [Cohaesibacter marisflavi]
MILKHNGKSPVIDPSCRIAPNATICGDVTLGANCSVGFGAVITAESGAVIIEENTVIMDTAVIRGVRDNPVWIGRNVLVGPRAYLTGCSISDDVFLATGCSVFNGAKIEAQCEVRVNAIVHLRTKLERGTVVPLGWIAVGNPARILPPEEHDTIWEIQKPLNFPNYVFGVKRPQEGETIMPDVMPRYAAALKRWHDLDVEDTQHQA